MWQHGLTACDGDNLHSVPVVMVERKAGLASWHCIVLELGRQAGNSGCVSLAGRPGRQENGRRRQRWAWQLAGLVEARCGGRQAEGSMTVEAVVAGGDPSQPDGEEA